ncbi:hypothetical protein L873DRAFT_1793323 [Choiromyces venosus 120613-1]|uniref:Uncharacterized protein n=1 Tax=Choiromyces venosus 120613-1 TaxID=1336337 RepID=A0A3N4J6F0_9PEZI|nr:hypothetical protein L873DRAFT_1793323 [Choiromyces venosus 120613-1]
MVKRLSLSDAPPPGNTHWDTARCKRVIRPLLIKLRALKEEVKRSETRTQKPSRRTPSPDSGDNYGENRFSARKKSKKPMRTYGALKTVYGKNTTQRASTSNTSVTVVPKGTKNIDYASLSYFDSSDAHLPLHWSASPECIAKGAVPTSLDLSTKIVKPIAFTDEANTRIHRHQEAVYVALDQFLFATSPPDKAPPIPTLASMAARQVAYCILAVGDDGMDWYDYVKGYGRSGEYLREVVRWHGVELLKDALADGGMGLVDGGPGAIGACIGLCRRHGAEREAEALLETLIFFHPIFSTAKTNPAFEIIRTYFSITPRGFVPSSSVYRIIAAFTPLVYKNSSWLSSKEIQAILIMAAKDIEVVPGADEIVAKLIESAYGLRSNYITGEKSPHENIKLRPMPRIGRGKGEEVIAIVIKEFIAATFQWVASNARSALIRLVKGYLLQDQASKALAEDVWGEGEDWAGLLTSKIMAMAHVQQFSCEETSCTDRCLETGCFKESLRDCRDEIALCLEHLTNLLPGDEGFLLAADYVHQCYIRDQSSTTKEQHEKELARINSFTGRLLASISDTSSSGYASMNVPKTPKASAPKVIIFTPGKSLSPEERKWEKRRYLIGQFVIRIATQYQESATSFKHEWVKWATNVEKKVLSLKIKTPLATTVLKEDLKVQVASPKVKKMRQGWRYEEGIGEWVSTGQTPGRKNKTPRRAGFNVVIHKRREGNWRQGYQELSGHGHVEDEMTDDKDGANDSSSDSEDRESDSESEEEKGSLYEGSDSEDTKINLPPPRSVKKTAAIRDSLKMFPMRSQLFIASSPAVGRSGEYSSPVPRDNLLSRFMESVEIPCSDPARGSEESGDEDSEDDEEDDRAVDEGDAEEVEVEERTAIPYSSPIVSRLTRRSQSPFITEHEPSTISSVAATSSPAQPSAWASSSAAPSPRPQSSHSRHTKHTYEEEEDSEYEDEDRTDTASDDSDTDSASDYKPPVPAVVIVTAAVPPSIPDSEDFLEDELSLSDATFACHRNRCSSSTPVLDTPVNAASPPTPGSVSSSNPPVSSTSKRKFERAVRHVKGKKRAMVRKGSIVEIARQDDEDEEEMSADELA